uniref:Uncharacterized protein n=1 Tax=Gossypium raimondii TaxID=29730 RepID=A0A0D2RXU3_GOSRA|nr:hypothetical protein B456_012G046300 [Gossypium raimondii]KJB75538.1 hypothetical protein B456_012G046300 [Gossypium raimondii]
MIFVIVTSRGSEEGELAGMLDFIFYFESMQLLSFDCLNRKLIGRTGGNVASDIVVEIRAIHCSLRSIGPASSWLGFDKRILLIGWFYYA